MNGTVAAGDPHTAQAGADVLSIGGNAVDAVVAAAFASFVSEAPLGSPAGGGVLLFGSVEAGFSLMDFFSVVPGLGGAAPEALDFFGATVDFGPTKQVFHIGRGAAAVPTALAGLLAAHRQSGHLPLREILQPAIALARDGFVITDPVQRIFSMLSPILVHSEGVREIYAQDPNATTVVPPGTTCRNEALGRFLDALANEGEPVVRDFYDAVLKDFGPAAGGLITEADLAGYRPQLREPLTASFLDTTLLTNAPPAAGGLLIAMGLKTLERHGLRAGVERWLDIGGALQVMALARQGRFDTSLREPGAAERLLADSEIDRLVAERARAVTERSLGSTTHISVVDGAGGAASLTISNGEGCGYAIEGFGVHMNNFLGEEDINPGGFHRQAPGTPMTTMMSPTIVLREGRPVLVLGSGGANRIRSVVLQAIVHAIEAGHPLPEVVSLPRLHIEGTHLWFESFGMEPAAVEALKERWPEHAEFTEPSMFFGGVHAVGPGGVAAGDPRRGGSVARG